MNIREFDRQWKSNIVFCMVDNTRNYHPDIRSLIKNQADHVLANVYNKGYKVLQWIDEDELLDEASKTNSKYALVFSTGTEFINGSNFFDSLENIIEKDFFLAGHILDRGDAYYELHHQCYLINLVYYKLLGKPKIGKQELGSKHQSRKPWRSLDNWHDDYTPKQISSGNEEIDYSHKCHGWNILRIAFENDFSVIVFDNSIRQNKIYLYPESENDFYKQLSWEYQRLNFCREEFIHTFGTENVEIKDTYQQIITPASSDWFINYVDNPGRIIYYDYNEKSLNYWKENHPKLNGVEFVFVNCDLLGGTDFLDYVDKDKKTFVNLSNIFNYEGTSFFYSKSYREYKQKEITEKIKSHVKDCDIFFSLSANLFSTIPTWHL